MALKLELTDNKGVKTRYYRIKSMEIEGGKIRVRLFGYVNQATRDAEKVALEKNALADAYDNNLYTLRQELNGSLGNEDETERIAELSSQINDLEFATDRPTRSELADTHYSEDDVVVDYFEPLTTEGVYQKVAQTDKYAGAESV